MDMKKNWWILTLNGVLAIVFGGLALFATEELIISLSKFFGLLVLIGGILLLLGAFDQKRKQKNYTLMLFEGAISVIIGGLIMIFPMQTVRLFLIFIGLWSMLLGLFKIYVSIVMRKILDYNFILALGGILLFAIGLVLLLDPDYIAGFLMKVLGAIFVLIGIILIYFSFAVKNAPAREG